MEGRNHIIKYGLYMYACIAGLFILMKILSLEHVTVLRFMNVVFLAFFSVRLAKIVVKDKMIEGYLNSLFIVFTANLIALLMSVVSLIIYMKFIDPSIIDSLKQSIWFTGDLSIAKIAGAIFIEGAASAVIISFAVMQFYKVEKQFKVKKVGQEQKA